MSKPEHAASPARVPGRAATARSLAEASRTARRRSSTALSLIACAFLATAVLRANGLRHEIGSVLTSPAHAAVPGNPVDGASDDATPGSATASADPSGGAEKPTATQPEHAAAGPSDHERCLDGAFHDALLEREQELAAIGLQIDQRRRELEVVERRVGAQLAELARQESALRAAFGQAESAAENEAAQLVSIYEKMKPKQAAQIFDHMPPEVAVGLVRRMRQTNSAPIMANMDPQKAYAISLLLASRSAAVREQ